MKGKQLTNIFKGDKTIWMIFFFLCVISILEVYSASSSLSYKGGNFWSPIIDHTEKFVMGWVVLVFVLNIECKYFKTISGLLYMGSVIPLWWLLVSNHTINEANRWVSLGFFQYQPAELGKGALVLVTAQVLSAMQTGKGADRKALRYILMASLPIIVPIGMENLSTAGILAATIFLMMFIGRVPLDQLGKLVGVAALGVILLGSVVMMVGNAESANAVEGRQTLTENTTGTKDKKKPKSLAERFKGRMDTWKGRIERFVSNEYIPPSEVDLRGKESQKYYSSIAVASSSIVGKGIGKSTVRDGLAQAYSDFIYAIILEEMGILGGVGVVLLYMFLLFRVFIIASRCENNFPAFLAMGLALLLVVQALFNMLVAVGLAPVTGQPLPLISRGGTSTVINCFYVGMILSISRSAKKKQERVA